MKKQCYLFIVTLILFVIPFASKGQANNEDVIYLKNGNIVYGTITERVNGQYVTIKTDDGNILTAKWDQIYRITSVPAYLPRKTDTVMYASGTKMSGYIGLAELNAGIVLVNNSNQLAYGFRIINGYLVSPEFSIGFGIGYDKSTYSFFPVFADFRLYTLGNSTCTVFSLDIGGSSNIDNSSANGGLMLSPGISEKIHLSKKTSLMAGIGYLFQSYTINSNSYYLVEHSDITSLRINVGVAFD